MSNASEYLDSRTSLEGDLGESFTKLQYLNKNRLWHELTIFLLDLIENTYFQNEFEMKELYEKFISTFETKINSYCLAKLVLKVASFISDSDQRIQYLESIAEKLKKEPASLILVELKIAEIKLKEHQDYSGCKELLDINRSRVEDNADIILSSHATFFKISAEYEKAKKNYEMFYREALRFLGCTDVESLDLSTQQSFAIDLSLAALIADNVYNFGELIIHPIFNSLKNSAHFWLYKLICAFNGGDIKTFEELQLYWRKENELLNNIHRIRRKIQLMTLLHIVFEKPTHERSLSFAYIAEQCSIPVNEVETLCMKALSLNLLKGTIDEVSQLVRVTWLQPRVLDLGQIALVSEQLKTWCTRLEDAIVFANSFGFRDSEKITS